ncbi:MAG: hypothetical protein ACK5WK_03025, partial [Hyphomonadaceae bacterium]
HLSPALSLIDSAFSGNRTRVNQHITNRQRFNDREMTVWRAIVAKVPHFFEQVGTINALVQTRKQNFALDSSKLSQYPKK